MSQIIPPYPTVTIPLALTGQPQRLTCPHCQADVQTTVNYQKGRMSHVVALILCLLGCWCGCCLIPYCLESCQDADHECPSCKRNIGTFQR